jgi:hypothetical protein
MDDRLPDAPLPVDEPLPVDALEPAPDEQPPPPAQPAVRAKAPSVGQSISGAFDLALAGSRQVRRASLYVAVLTLALLGPATVLFMAIVRDQGSLEAALSLVAGPASFGRTEQDAVTFFKFSFFCGVFGLLAILVEAQIIVAAILGGVATGKRIGIRGSLRLSRSVFWRVFAASFLVGVLGSVAGLILINVLDPTSLGELQGAQIWAIVVQIAVAAPFAYSLAGIVVGGVGPIESLKRSIRIAAARWRLAFLIALAGAVIGVIQDFALGAGFDVVSRIATAAGLGLDGSIEVAIFTGLLILATVMAIGSLLVTVTALIVAPQVFVFLRMTGYSAGLDRATADTRPPRLVTWPMRILIAVGGIFAILGLTSL